MTKAERDVIAERCDKAIEAELVRINAAAKKRALPRL